MHYLIISTLDDPKQKFLKKFLFIKLKEDIN